MVIHCRCLIASVLGSILLSYASAAYAATVKVIHDFAHGQIPSSGLLAVNGKFYGTAHGGAYGNGIVYSLDPATGREKVLSSLGDGDGKLPSGGLVDVKGKLYGTAAFGGKAGAYCMSGCGTVFSVNMKTGALEVVYYFYPDGYYPSGSLIDVHGTLYGTTSQGGSSGGGTVFSVDPVRAR